MASTHDCLTSCLFLLGYLLSAITGPLWPRYVRI